MFAIGVLAASAIAHADPETPQLTHSYVDRDDDSRLRADQDALEKQRLELEHARAEAVRAKLMEDLDRSEWDHENRIREHRRHLGYAMVGVTAGFGIAAGLMAKLGSDNNHTIQRGGFSTSADIKDAADTGQIYNYVGEGALVAAGVTAAIAAGLIVFNLDRGDFEVAPTATAHGGGLSFSGRF